MTGPLYIEQNGDPVLPPPYSFPGHQTRSFPLAASLGHLTTLVDRFLNIAPPEEMGFAFAPLAPLVYVTLNTDPRMISDPPPFNEMGFTSQQELQIAIPVVLSEADGGPLGPREIGWFSAWLVVDNPWSVTTGREVLGFPKVLGWIQVPGNFPNPYPSSVETLVYPQYSPETPLTRKPLLEVRAFLDGEELPEEMQRWQQKVEEEGPGRIGPLGCVDLLFGPEAPFAVRDQPIWELIERSTLELQIHAYQLEQLRDPAQPETAAYQAITRSVLHVSSPLLGPVLPWGPVEFQSWDSLDIPQALGIPPKSYPWLPYWITGDALLDQTGRLFSRC